MLGKMKMTLQHLAQSSHPLWCYIFYRVAKNITLNITVLIGKLICAREIKGYATEILLLFVHSFTHPFNKYY